MSLVVSLTTIPSRLDYLPKVIESLLNQDYDNFDIHLFIPKEYRRFKYTNLNIPDYVIQNTTVNFIDKDYGPLTKILPALKMFDSPVIAVDDDCLLHPKTVSTLYEFHLSYPKDAISLRGRRFVTAHQAYINSQLIQCNQIEKPISVDLITGVWGALYTKEMFDLDNFENMDDEIFFNDDIAMAIELKNRNVKRLVVPMDGAQQPTDAHAVDDLWSNNVHKNNTLMQRYWQ